MVIVDQVEVKPVHFILHVVLFYKYGDQTVIIIILCTSARVNERATTHMGEHTSIGHML